MEEEKVFAESGTLCRACLSAPTQIYWFVECNLIVSEARPS